MNLYQLGIAPGEDDPEGEDYSEWFSSLAKAKKRRDELIAENPDLEGHRYGADFAITLYAVRLPLTKSLLLKVLNRRGWAQDVRDVVPAYVRPENR